MAASTDLVRTGFSAGQAHGLPGQLAFNQTAAGTTQGTAFAIQTSNVHFGTVGANSGAILPNSSHRDSHCIYNAGSNPLTIYPPVGSRIYPAATNVGITLGNPGFIQLYKWSDTVWVGNLSA